MKRIALTAAALTVGSVAFSQDFGTLDRNNDGVVSEREFIRGFQGFEAWDTDNSGTLNMDEFVAGMRGISLFANHDTDNDGFISPREFNHLDDYDDFPEWDRNRDGKLSPDEVYAELFDEFDDNDNLTLTRAEFNEGWFDLWDVNDDDYLNVREFDTGHARDFGTRQANR